jgi:hypothetical protein
MKERELEKGFLLMVDLLGGGVLDWERAINLISEFNVEDEFVERVQEYIREGVMDCGSIDPVAVALSVIGEKALNRVRKLGYSLPEPKVYGNYIASSYYFTEGYTVSDFKEAQLLLEALKNYPEVEFVYGELIEVWVEEFVRSTIYEIEDAGWKFATDGSKLFLIYNGDRGKIVISEEGITKEFSGDLRELDREELLEKIFEDKTIEETIEELGRINEIRKNFEFELKLESEDCEE